MITGMVSVSREMFLEYLHDALTHLYNADQLRKSKLAVMLGMSNRFDTSSALRKILADAIEKLKPSTKEPDQSRAWRTYECLYCCFIQQLNQQVVADQLCISVRQLRREQHAALEIMADQMWVLYNLDKEPSDASFANLMKNIPSEGLVTELDWIKETQPSRPTSLSEELESVLEITRPIAARKNVLVKNKLSLALPSLAIHPVILNQVLVSLLNISLQQATGGSVTITAQPARYSVLLNMQAGRSAGSALPFGDDFQNNLQIAEQMVKMAGGKLTWTSEGSESFLAQLEIPSLEQLPVLVVDDNEDTLQLLLRYSVGTRYRLICTKDSEQILPLFEKASPSLILLDIMMPKENGWMVLGRLRQHPLTRMTPVIICTILPQEELALSLGASAFLKKPVNRRDFLFELDRLSAQMALNSD
jgi:CheY-like chemotaxis protein